MKQGVSCGGTKGGFWKSNAGLLVASLDLPSSHCCWLGLKIKLVEIQ